MKKRLMVLAGAFLLGLSVYSQSGEKVVKSRLGVYFSDYQTSYTTATDRCKIERVKVDASVRTVEIYLNELFAGQSFSRDKVKGIYRDVKRLLPAPLYYYYIWQRNLHRESCYGHERSSIGSSKEMGAGFV